MKVGWIEIQKLSVYVVRSDRLDAILEKYISFHHQTGDTMDFAVLKKYL